MGRIVGQTAAGYFKPCSLEMGGKNAMIVLEDANLDLALDGAVWGAFGTTGQRCTATSRIIVQKGIAAEFTRRLVERAQALRVGDGLDAQVEMGPQINQQQVETSERYTAIANKEGARLLTGGQRWLDGLDKGFFFAPTVFGGVGAEMRIAREEVFGPVVSVIECDSFDQAIAFANGIQYGLVDCAVFPQREPGVQGDARPGSRDYLHQCADDWGRGASALRRSEADRQRPSRRRHRSA